MTSPLHHSLKTHPGFTLVELMVTLVIISILLSLSLAGLNGARQRSKYSKTQSTLRKLNDAIVAQSDSYVRRRVPVHLVTSSTISTVRAQARLQLIRALQVLEMPDSWGDVLPNPASASALPTFLRSGPVAAYAAASQAGYSPAFGGAECLYMIVAQSGLRPDQLEQFRTDEIADYDADGAPEFKDGWNTPIHFIRWAPAFSAGVAPPGPWVSPIQIADAVRYHDPLDIQNVDPQGYALTPLIISCGPDEERGCALMGDAGTGFLPYVPSNSLALLTTITGTASPFLSLGAALDAQAVRDNITNHDLTRK
jgi:prepilin-type N-terminal cleavage/methylation domain-containing protein